MIKAQGLDVLQILGGRRRKRYFGRTVHAFGNKTHGFGDFGAFGVNEIQGFRVAFARREYFAGEVFGTGAALGEAVAKRDPHALGFRTVKEHLEFRFVVPGKVVYRHDDVGAEGLEVVNVGFEVAEPLLKRLRIRSADVGKRDAAVPMQRPQARDEYRRRGRQAGRTALDVVEFFRPQVAAEAGFGDGVVSERHRGFGRCD